MAFAIKDRVREQISGASGTGPFTLPNSAVPGFQTFLSGWGASGSGFACLVVGSQWQTALCTINAGGTSITVTTAIAGSSGVGVAVNFTAGTMDAFGCDPATLYSNLTATSKIDAFPSGTLLLFQQTAAPTGWTKATTHNDKALRVVSGTASSGGSSAFSTVFGKTATDTHTMSAGELVSHSHPIAYGSGAAGSGGLSYTGTDSSSPFGAISTGLTGGGSPFTMPIDIRVQYVDCIIAAKD